VFAAQQHSSWKPGINYTYTASKPVVTPAMWQAQSLGDIALTVYVGFYVLMEERVKEA